VISAPHARASDAHYRAEYYLRVAENEREISESPESFHIAQWSCAEDCAGDIIIDGIAGLFTISMFAPRASTLRQVAKSRNESPIAGMIAQASSPARDAVGTSSDWATFFWAKLDRNIASSATAQAAAAIQKIASASG
jgi:hypothetical protein